jgi:uncharacterized membrane protein YesL
MIEQDPLAVIKVTFDDLPESVKSNVQTLFTLVIVFIVSLLIIMYLYVIDTVIHRIYRFRKYIGYQEMNS